VTVINSLPAPITFPDFNTTSRVAIVIGTSEGLPEPAASLNKCLVEGIGRGCVLQRIPSDKFNRWSSVVTERVIATFTSLYTGKLEIFGRERWW
jgi:hypothetical protein